MQWNLSLAVSDLTGIWVNLRPDHIHGKEEFTKALKQLYDYGIRSLKLFPGAVQNPTIEPDFNVWVEGLKNVDPAYGITMGRHARRIVDCIERTPQLDNYHRFLVIKFGCYCRRPPRNRPDVTYHSVLDDPMYPLSKAFMFDTSWIENMYRQNHTQFYGSVYTSIKSPGEEETKPWP